MSLRISCIKLGYKKIYKRKKWIFSPTYEGLKLTMAYGSKMGGVGFLAYL